jgi:SecD/SecF fusion protein
LITSGTTLIVVIILLLFGGEVLRGFSFALFIGIVIGTYSSIFIATPIVLDLDVEKAVSKKSDAKAAA